MSKVWKCKVKNETDQPVIILGSQMNGVTEFIGDIPAILYQYQANSF